MRPLISIRPWLNSDFIVATCSHNEVLSTHPIIHCLKKRSIKNKFDGFLPAHCFVIGGKKSTVNDALFRH